MQAIASQTVELKDQTWGRHMERIAMSEVVGGGCWKDGGRNIGSSALAFPLIRNKKNMLSLVKQWLEFFDIGDAFFVSIAENPLHLINPLSHRQKIILLLEFQQKKKTAPLPSEIDQCSPVPTERCLWNIWCPGNTGARTHETNRGLGRFANTAFFEFANFFFVNYWFEDLKRR